jgi:predicted nuclease of restriction endonuclease-like RecB superfamily
LTPADYPWLRVLLDEYERFFGRRRGELKQHLAQPLPVKVPWAKWRMAVHVLERLTTDRTAAPVPPRRLRATLFTIAASADSREEALAAAGHALGLDSAAIEGLLFADLPGERVVRPPAEPLSPADLAEQTNASLVAALLKRAMSVKLAVWGNARAVVRHARLRGLVCVVHPGRATDSVTLELSGPLALFRHTLVYGRALASLVPRAAWCHRFVLEADCVMADGEPTARLLVRTGDPVGAARELPRYDSKLEERFARAFARAAPDWILVREPCPLSVGKALAFPDFELQHRRDPRRRWLLEIVGYWTPEYLERKLATLAKARVPNLLLCVDEARNCTCEKLPRQLRLVRFKRRLDPAAVLQVIDPCSG